MKCLILPCFPFSLFWGFSSLSYRNPQHGSGAQLVDGVCHVPWVLSGISPVSVRSCRLTSPGLCLLQAPAEKCSLPGATLHLWTPFCSMRAMSQLARLILASVLGPLPGPGTLHAPCSASLAALRCSRLSFAALFCFPITRCSNRCV